MKRKTLEKKSIFGAMRVMLMLTVASLTGCASSQTVETTVTKESAKAAVEEDDNAEKVTVGMQEEADAETAGAKVKEEVTSGTEEATEEDAAESANETEGAEQKEASEGGVYEGIDMESTLPGVEWIETFKGIITEPKFVIFNDETNKKVIVENGQEVEFCDTDTLGLFVPTDKVVYVYPLEDNYTFRKNSVVNMDIKIFYNPTSSLNNGDKVDITQKLELDGTDVILTFKLVMKKDM